MCEPMSNAVASTKPAGLFKESDTAPGLATAAAEPQATASAQGKVTGAEGGQDPARTPAPDGQPEQAQDMATTRVPDRV